ncbi:hypothetical protein [Streptomyces sp. NPDC018045]
MTARKSWDDGARAAAAEDALTARYGIDRERERTWAPSPGDASAVRQES